MIFLSSLMSLTSLPTLFVEGGPISMSILTILLVCLLFAAWKAPAWVKEIGSAALVFSILAVGTMPLLQLKPAMAIFLLHCFGLASNAALLPSATA